MRITKVHIGTIILGIALLLTGCKQGPYSSKKQIKKGKPIPCPLKDC